MVAGRGLSGAEMVTERKWVEGDVEDREYRGAQFVKGVELAKRVTRDGDSCCCCCYCRCAG